MSEFVEELNNILTHKYVKNYQVIMDVDEQDRHIACHYLFSYYPYDLFFVEKNNYTNWLNSLMPLNYEQQLHEIEQFKKYDILYKQLLFETELKNTLKEDKILFIKNYPENEIVSNNLKSLLLFTECDHYDKKYNSDIINLIKLICASQNINDEIDQYFATYRDTLTSKLNDMECLPIGDKTTLYEYIFIKLLNMLVNKKLIQDFNFCNHVKIFIKKIKDIPNFSNMLESIELVYHSKIKSSEKTPEDYEKLIGLQIKFFEKNKTVSLLADILSILALQKKYDEITTLLNDSYNRVLITTLKNNKLVLKVFMQTLLNILINNNDQNVTNFLESIFYNDIKLFIANHHKSAFVSQKPCIDSRKLKDADDESRCIICFESYDEYVLMCTKCLKYVGHSECVKKYLITGARKCPYCNS